MRCPLCQQCRVSPLILHLRHCYIIAIVVTHERPANGLKCRARVAHVNSKQSGGKIWMLSVKQTRGEAVSCSLAQQIDARSIPVANPRSK